MTFAYELIPKLNTPTINSGDLIEIDLFISGYGKVKQTKLSISYGSKNLIKFDDPGEIIHSISFATNPTTGESQPVSVKKHHQKQKLDPYGTTVILNEGYLTDVPLNIKVPYGFSPIMSEQVHDKIAPFYIKLNTQEKTVNGDYDVDFVFTYGDEKIIKTNHKKVTVHVSSFTEKNGKWIELGGIIGTGIGITVAILLSGSF